MPRSISKKDILPLALGASYLGSGGGGDADTTVLLLEQLMEEREEKPLLLYSLDEIDEHATVIPVGYVGAPFVALERLSSGFEWKALHPYIDMSRAVFAPTEIGGSNALTALLAGICLDRPICDADSLGRAFPTVDICSLHVKGIHVTPAYISDEYGRVTILEKAASPRELEEIIRKETIRRGSSAALTMRPLSSKEAKEGLIHGSISQALLIGKVLLGLEHDIEQELSHILHTQRIGSGTVIDVQSNISDGFCIGKLSLQAEEGELTLFFQNEFLAADRQGKRIAETPDIITCLDHGSRLPISCEKIQWGQKIDVMRSDSPDIWREPKAYSLVRPSAFGYG